MFGSLMIREFARLACKHVRGKLARRKNAVPLIV